jgi:hypothetical protein
MLLHDAPTWTIERLDDYYLVQVTGGRRHIFTGPEFGRWLLDSFRGALLENHEVILKEAREWVLRAQ